MPIDFYKTGQPFDFLSNVTNVRVRMNMGGRIYNARSSEALFQGIKGLTSSVHGTKKAAEDLILDRAAPGAHLQRKGQALKLKREEMFYDKQFGNSGDFFVKEQVMYELLLAKATQNPEIAKALLATGNDLITERTSQNKTYNDHFWGDGWAGTGRNALGKAWMQVRDTLRKELQAQGQVRVRTGFSAPLADALHLPRAPQYDGTVITQAKLHALPRITTVSDFESAVRSRPSHLFSPLISHTTSTAPRTSTGARRPASSSVSANGSGSWMSMFGGFLKNLFKAFFEVWAGLEQLQQKLQQPQNNSVAHPRRSSGSGTPGSHGNAGMRRSRTTGSAPSFTPGFSHSRMNRTRDTAQGRSRHPRKMKRR